MKPVVSVDFNAIRSGHRIVGVARESDQLKLGQTVRASDGHDVEAQGTVIAIRFGFSGREIVELQIDPDTYTDLNR
jgi:hypothetical protein